MRWDYRARNAHCPGANVTNSAHGLSKVLGEYRALPGGTGFQPVCLFLHRLEAGATQASPSIIASPHSIDFTLEDRDHDRLRSPRRLPLVDYSYPRLPETSLMRLAAVLSLLVSLSLLPAQQPKGQYVKKSTRTETVTATLASHGLPNLAGKWYYAGPFDNTERKGLDFAYPPEKKLDLKDAFRGKNGAKFGWKEFKQFQLGKVVDLAALFPADKDYGIVYLFHEFDSPREYKWPLSLGSDD